jgi:oligopeptide transport system substrate-binding protein
MELLYNSSPLNQRTAEWLQHSWSRELGLDVNLRNLDAKSARDAQRALDYDLSRSSWVGDYLDPTTFLDIFLSSSTNNRTGWSDPEYDALLDRAARIPSGEIRNTLLHQAERVLLERGPVIPLWYGVGTSLVSPRLQGLGRNVIDQQWPKRLRWAGARPR